MLGLNSMEGCVCVCVCKVRLAKQFVNRKTRASSVSSAQEKRPYEYCLRLLVNLLSHKT